MASVASRPSAASFWGGSNLFQGGGGGDDGSISGEPCPAAFGFLGFGYRLADRAGQRIEHPLNRWGQGGRISRRGVGGMDAASGLVVLGEGPVSTRNFSRWSMRARRLTPADNAILQTPDLKRTFDPHGLMTVRPWRCRR